MKDYARLRPLIGASPEDVAATMSALLENVDDKDLRGNVRITLLAGDGPSKWDLDLGTKECAAAQNAKSNKKSEHLDLELVMSAATWTEIALGRLAPLAAFGAGRLRLRGDSELANRIYERLKDDGGGVTSVCK